MKQRSPEWFEARKGRVTGSVVGAILGLAPYMSRDEVMRSMVRSYHGAESEFQGNIATSHGTRMEPEAVAQYEMETGNTVEEVGFFTHDNWLGTSPDGFIGDDGLLEAKCPFGIRNDQTPKFKTIEEQPHYYAQIQVQLFVTGRKWCAFYQWTAYGSSIETISVDQQWLDKHLPLLREFHNEYLKEIDNQEHLEPLRVEVNTNSSKSLIDELDQLKDAIDNANERKKEVEAEIVKMCDGKNAEVWGRKITKVERKGSVKYTSIPELKGVDLDQYRGKSSSHWRIG